MRIVAAALVAVFAAQAAAAQKRENRPFNTVNGRTVSGGSAAPRGVGGGPPANAPQGIAVTPPFNGGKTFWSGGRRRSGSAEAPPPNFNKPGALIRTAGQAPKYGNLEPERRHTVYAGEIAIDARKARDVGRAPSLQHGPKDTLPPPTPISGAAAGGGAGPNSTTVINNGAHNNTNGNQGGSNGANKKDPFADPTGFNDAF